MKKNILIGTLMMAVTFFIVYAQIKANEAAISQQKLQEQKTIAEESAAIAEEAQRYAQDQVTKAAIQIAQLEEALAACQE